MLLVNLIFEFCVVIVQAPLAWCVTYTNVGALKWWSEHEEEKKKEDGKKERRERKGGEKKGGKGGEKKRCFTGNRTHDLSHGKSKL